MISSRRNFLLLFSLLCITATSTAQNQQLRNEVRKGFEKYFELPRETIYLHVNKSHFILGEHIWFKGYLYNRQKKQPFTETTNVHLRLFNQKGDLVKDALFEAKDGMFSGQIELDSTVKRGEHFLSASTKWDKNFAEKGRHSQRISILGAERNKKTEVKNILFFPEGGHLINEIQNTVGVKVIGSRNLGGIIGVIKSFEGDSLASFTTNEFGFAKFQFVPRRGHRYHAEIQSGIIEGKIDLPEVKIEGVNLTVKDIEEDKVFIVVGKVSNGRTKDFSDSRYSLFIHRDGLLKMLPIQFNNNNRNYDSHLLDRKELLPGINIVTLVNNKGKPLAERIFYNPIEVATDDATIFQIKSTKDSLRFVVKSNSKKVNNNFSISVLPSQTEAYKFSENIFSKILLSPYINGPITNAKYYFENSSPERLAKLDLLLITQGWSSYNWDKILNEPPNVTYKFERGVTIKGRLANVLEEDEKLMLFKGGNTTKPTVLPIAKDDKSFLLPNYFIKNGEKVQFSLFNKKGQLRKPKLALSYGVNLGVENLNVSTVPHFASTTANETFTDYFGFDFSSFKDLIVLDEVVVSEERIEEEDEPKLIFEHKLTKVTNRVKDMYPNFLEIVRANGYNVTIYETSPPQGTYDRVLINTRRKLRFDEVQPSPILFIDDIQQFNFDRLLEIGTEDIDSYYIDKGGDGQAGAAGGVIRLYTKRKLNTFEGYNNEEFAQKFYEHQFKGVFEQHKKYYSPNYSLLGQEFYNKFGVIQWLPNIKTGNSSEKIIQIHNECFDEIVFYLEGMSDDGRLFSEIKKVKLKKYEPSK